MLLIDTIRRRVLERFWNKGRKGMKENGKSVGIFTCKVEGCPAWDPDSIHTGITGSEEAVIYLSRALAELGFEVLIFGNPPKDSVYSKEGANPRFVDAHTHRTEKLDRAICWRMPTLGPLLKQIASRVYLWPHDVCTERLSAQQMAAFDGVLWLSHWQKEQWTAINPGLKKQGSIVGNGIDPEQFLAITERKNPFSCIYGSNYSRGLEQLLSIWPDVKRVFAQATLDIYYGWQSFGLLSEEREKKLRSAIAKLSSLDVVERGQVGHAALNAAYGQSGFWTYPCQSPETFCITALRAQFAGAIPVIVQGSALQETVRHGYYCMKQEHYLTALLRAMSDAQKISVEQRKSMRAFIEKEYTWEKIAQKCQNLFEESV